MPWKVCWRTCCWSCSSSSWNFWRASGSMNSYSVSALIWPAGVVRQLVERLELALGHAFQHLLEPLSVIGVAFAVRGSPAGPRCLHRPLAALCCCGQLLAALIDPRLDPFALELLDLLQLLLDALQDRAEVVAVQLLLPAGFEPVHQVADARHSVAVRPVHAPAEEPLEGTLQVAIGEHVVGDGVHDVVGR